MKIKEYLESNGLTLDLHLAPDRSSYGSLETRMWMAQVKKVILNQEVEVHASGEVTKEER